MNHVAPGSASQVLVRLKGGSSGPFARCDWSFVSGRQWALMGDGRVLRSMFCEVVAGELPPPAGTSVCLADGLEGHVRLLSFAQQRDAVARTAFRQARYHSIVDDAGPDETVAEFLSFNRVFDINPFEVGNPRRRERSSHSKALRAIRGIMQLSDLWGRAISSLSNGEMRRVLMARALLGRPRLLVLDDPCAGLDGERRDAFKELCGTLAKDGVSLLVNVNHADEIPDCVTDVIETRNGRFSFHPVRHAARTPPAAVRRAAGVVKRRDGGGVPVVELKNIHVSFGRRVLLVGFSWTIGRGERWVLQGANGSGKTTLLSMIAGDNPLAYANDVTVFGFRRGPGVELARIRRRIGMVSPEQQAYEGKDAETLLEEALGRNPDLLLLDEPCLNMDEKAARRLKLRVSAWLRCHPSCTAICVAHRIEDVPEGFGPVMSLD